MSSTHSSSHSSSLKLKKPPHLQRIVSISCSQPARSLISLLRQEEVTLVMDTRLAREYRGVGFCTREDDFRFLCELAGIQYSVVSAFMPTSQMRHRFAQTFQDVKRAADRDPEAWTNFLREYEELMMERRPLTQGRSAELLYGEHKVIAFVCACRHHDDCHRSYGCGLISQLLPDVELRVCYSESKQPPRASPRRRRTQAFPWANLSIDPTLKRDAQTKLNLV